MSYISVIGMKLNTNASHPRTLSKRSEKGVNQTHVLISLLLVQSSIKINELRNLKFLIKSNRNIGTFSNENTALACVYKWKKEKKEKTKEKHNKRRCIALHCTFLQTCDREQSYRKKVISAFTEQACAYKIENSYKKKKEKT